MNKPTPFPATADPVGFDVIRAALIDSHLLLDVEQASFSLREAVTVLVEMGRADDPHIDYLSHEYNEIADACRRLNDLVRRMPQGGEQ